VVIIPAADRFSRGAIDLLVMAGDMQRTAAGLRSRDETVLNRLGQLH
jgi:hypothetical protein